MLSIKSFRVNMLQENCFVVSDDTREAVIIDCGALRPEEREGIREYIDGSSLKPVRHICTHAHFDHIFGCGYIYDTYGLKPEIHAADAFLYDNCAAQLRDLMGLELDIKLPPLGPYISEDSKIAFGAHSFSVIPTPGHTPGGISFYCAEEGVVFCGDSLFRHSVGRTDNPYGDFDLLISKLREGILTLPDATTLYPGHGAPSTVRQEKAENPFFTTLS